MVNNSNVRKNGDSSDSFGLVSDQIDGTFWFRFGCFIVVILTFAYDQLKIIIIEVQNWFFVLPSDCHFTVK